MRLRTEIERTPLPRPLDLHEGLLLLGSCFTDHIGEWLTGAWLPVMCNPWGILFNPASIAASLGRLTGGHPYVPELHEQGGRYYSFDHHGKWSGCDAEALRQRLVVLDGEVHDFLAGAKHLWVTLGTSWVYEREGRVVANCHKFPAREFNRRQLSIAEMVDGWSQLIGQLNAGRTAEERLTITFTVSPIRHVKETLHGNQLSKAALLLAIDKLQRLYPDQVQYLPVYELLIDDLRDYRFYADDLVHPSPLAIEAVKELVGECLMTPRLRQYMQEVEPIVRALNHRPTDPESPQYKEFLQRTLQSKDALLAKF